jgi:hypothetical protein
MDKQKPIHLAFSTRKVNGKWLAKTCCGKMVDIADTQGFGTVCTKCSKAFLNKS